MTSKEEQKPNKEPPKPEVKPRQANVDSFWASFYAKHPGTVYNVLPTESFREKDTTQSTKSKGNGERAVISYEEAALACKQAVDKISKDCRSVNQKYRDQDFDIEYDLKLNRRDYLDGLDTKSEDAAQPKATKRIPDIFTNPQFYVDGASPSDVKQGSTGDCWWIAAIACMSNKKGLIEKVCVARDEAIGVYGFVFHRDGEWFHTIVDDKLYVVAPDWHEALTSQKMTFDKIYNDRDGERKFRDALQKGSAALCFAKCRDDNETWLPLLEKAYAKAHGDYSALDGGFSAEGVEDLTGSVGTRLAISDILDKEQFWHDEICHVNKDVLLSCYTGFFDDWQGSDTSLSSSARSGIVAMHIYSILEAVEKNGQKLVKLRNPWNPRQSEESGVFRGDWSDGSKQWTPEWMQDLQYRFSDDKGAFWMSYNDMLEKFATISRTRLFDDSWTITQRWTSIYVPFSQGINNTEFRMTITKGGPVVLVLSQLDDRYFQSMRGEYYFIPKLFLHREGEDDYILRGCEKFISRSVSIDLPKLDPGKYSVRLEVTASRRYWEEPEDPEELKGRWVPEKVLRRHYKTRPEKVLQQARAYDFAHAKGMVNDSDEEDEVAEDPHVVGDGNVTVEPKNSEINTAAGVIPDASKGTTTDAAVTSSPPTDPPTDPITVGAPSTSSSGEAGGSPSEDKDTDKDDKKDADEDTPALDPNKEPSKRKNPQSDIERQDAELAQNPWNAVCLVGLRVFSKDENCSIKVIRPFRQKEYVPKPNNDGDKKKGAL